MTTFSLVDAIFWLAFANRGKVRCSNPPRMADSDLTGTSAPRSARGALHAVGDAVAEAARYSRQVMSKGSVDQS